MHKVVEKKEYRNTNYFGVGSMTDIRHQVTTDQQLDFYTFSQKSKNFSGITSPPTLPVYPEEKEEGQRWTIRHSIRIDSDFASIISVRSVKW